MPGRFLIYGATGYTGRLTARRAKTLGLRPILAGRDVSKLRALSAALGFSYRVVSLEDPYGLDTVLREVDLVLNIAGPFTSTAAPLADACLRNRVHYLDVTGEIPVFADLHRRHDEAAANGVMIMPGVGFVVVPSDCLAAHVAARLPGARRLRIGFSRADFVSRGSAKTMMTLINDGAWIRREGSLQTVPVGSLQCELDYGDGPKTSTAVSWADVYTAFYTTNIPNIEAFTEANALERGFYELASGFAWLLKTPPWQALLKLQVQLLPEAPLIKSDKPAERVIVAEAEDAAGRQACSRLHTYDGYTFTPIAALAIVERVLAGELRPGFQTPALVYGADFVLSLEGVHRQDLPVSTPADEDPAPMRDGEPASHQRP